VIILSDKKLTWAEISAKLKEEQMARKTLLVDICGDEVEFVIRQLTQREEDQAQAKMSMKFSKNQKGSGEIPMEMSGIKLEKFKYGVVSGPEGFDPKNPIHVGALPASVRDEIVSCIDEFSSLDEVTRLSFRGIGRDGQGSPSP